ncbi:MAG: hypothetical protein WCI92_10980 [Bacteroidota bacterium]
MKPKTLTTLLAMLMFMEVFHVKAQEKNAFSVKASAELVSCYVWRGAPAYSSINGQTTLSPNIQPTLGFVFGGLEIGAWGSTDFTGTYQEMNLYASYSTNGITATITDYYWDADWATTPYFLYKNETTGHIIEGSLAYGFKKIPLKITMATMLYGADKKPLENENDKITNNFSTYFELGYSFKVNAYNFDTFMGITPADGFYGDGYGNVTGFGVVNLGVTGYKKIQISEKFETTLRSSLIFNPQQEKAYLVLGIAF